MKHLSIKWQNEQYPQILIKDDDGKTEVSFKSQNLTGTFLSALTRIYKHKDLAEIDNTFVFFIDKHRDFALRTFHFADNDSGLNKSLILVPSYVHTDSDFYHYLTENGIYDIPTGYQTVYFIRFYTNIEKRCIKRIPIIDGKILPVVAITPKEMTIIGNGEIDLSEHLIDRNFGKIGDKLYFICRKNVEFGSSQELSMMDDLCLYLQKQNDIEYAEVKRKLKSVENIRNILRKMNNN